MSTPAPLVSVYLVNHNYGQFIPTAIDSVLNQTLQDFELIIIDDGSTDDSLTVIRQYADHQKVTIIFQENQGLNITNNIALRAARGTFIIRLDADDWLDQNALQVMVQALQRNPELGLVFPDYYRVDTAGHVLDIVRRHDFNTVELFDQPAHGACTMIRRQCLLDIEGYDETFRCQDGWDLWVRFIRRYRVSNVNLPLFYYRQHSNNLTRNEQRLLATRADILAKQSVLAGNSSQGLAIIPVRGPQFDSGSIALEKLGDRTVIDWTIDAALNAQRIRTVVVTSPDDDILHHVQSRYGKRVIALPRDPNLAAINTHIEQTVSDVLSRVAPPPSDISTLAVLYVECPFRAAPHIDMAFDVLHLFETDTVIGVRPEVDTFYQHDGSGLVPVRSGATLRLEREDIFRAVGQMHVVRREYFEASGRITGGRIGHVVLEQTAAHYLRSEWDIEMARAIAARHTEASVPPAALRA